MKRAAKLAGLLALFAVLAAGAGALAIQALLPPEKVRALVVTGAKKSLGRDVTLGRVTVGLVSGLSLENLAVSEVGGFGAGTFASIERFNLRVALPPLLQRRIVIDSLSAKGVAVKIDENAALPGGKGPAASSEASEVELAVRRLDVEDARVEYRKGGSRVEARLNRLRVSGFAPSGLFSADFAGRASGTWEGKPFEGAATFKGRVDLGGRDPRRLRVEADRLEASVGGWSAKLSGRLSDLATPDVDLKFAAAGPAGPLGDGSFAGKLSRDPLAARGRLSFATPGLDPAAAQALGLPAGMPLPALTASADVVYTPEGVAFDKLVLKTEAGSVEGSAALKGRGSPEADLALALDLPAVRAGQARWLKLPEGLAVPAMKVSGKLRLRGDALELAGVEASGPGGAVKMTGKVAGAASGRPQPDLEATVDLSLPPLKSADFPLPGVPPGLFLPASRWEGSLAYSSDEIKIRSLRLVVGSNDLQIDSGRISKLGTDAATVALLVKCRRFDLGELTALTPEAKKLGLTGTGLFAIAANGRLARPVLQGKLQFKDVGAVFSGLTFSGFSGTATFDEKRIDLPDLRGRLGDGDLIADLTVKDYVKTPDIHLQAGLTTLDLAKLMAAKKSGASPQPAAAVEPKPVAPISARGKITIERLLHPNAEARDVRLTWDLSGITPGLESLDGEAKLSSAGGKFTDLAAMGGQSKILRVLMFPLLIVQKIGTLIRVLPDLNNIRFDDITGDYAFKEGTMTLRDSRLHGSDVNVSVAGTIDLPREKPDLVVTAKVGTIAPVDVEVKGTFDKPVTRVKVAKILTDTGKRLIEGLLKK